VETKVLGSRAAIDIPEVTLRSPQKQYWFAILPAAVLILVGWFIPQLQPNEPGRLISMRQVLDPSFPAPDWLQVAGYDEDRLTIAFKVLLSPLWLVTHDPILVALMGRIIVWVLLLWSFVTLARAMTLPPYFLAWALVLWIGFGQSLGAHEWLFNGVEGKCFAYALLLFSLAAILRSQMIQAAILCGLSWWFHVPVAAWTTLAVVVALIVCFRDYGKRRFLQFSLVTGALLMPMVLVALQYTSNSGLVGGNPYADWIVVVFRNPHHLDPNYFHGGIEFFKMTLCALVAMVGLRALTSKPASRFLISFVVVLVLEFGAGMLARKFDLFWYLKTYPFRVADVLVWLFCCLSLPMVVQQLLSRFQRKEFSAAPTSMFKYGGIASLLAVTTVCLLRGNAWDGRHSIRDFTRSWMHYAHQFDTPHRAMTRWIRANTPKTAIFVTDGGDAEFWLEAERAEVVNYKRNPHNGLAVEWYQRYSALNGRPFQGVAIQTRSEIDANFPLLSRAELADIRKRYGGDYFLTTKARSDLRAQLVYENTDYYLYALNR
jgi:hypothetical protein